MLIFRYDEDQREWSPKCGKGLFRLSRTISADYRWCVDQESASTWEDVQVLHGFDSKEHAAAYLESEMFKEDVAKGLSPYFQADPEIRIFTVAG